MLRHVPLGLVLCVAAGCGSPASTAPARTIRIATGLPGGVYHPLGGALARIFDEAVPSTRAFAEPTPGSVFNLNALRRGALELALARAEVAYTAYERGTSLYPSPDGGLRGVAVLFTSALHIVVPYDSPVRQISDLRRLRIGYAFPPAEPPPPVSYADLVTLGGSLVPEELVMVPMGYRDLVDALEAGSVDGGLVLAGYPVAILSDLSRRMRIRLLDVETDAAARIRGRSAFYKPVFIPPGTYDGQSQEVRTVGVDNLLVCRDELEEELVYDLTKAFFDRLPQVARGHPVARQLDPDLAPLTPIPLHRGAARYYRERELLR